MAISLIAQEGGHPLVDALCFNEVPLTLPSTYPSGEQGVQGGAPGSLLRLRAASWTLSFRLSPRRALPLSSQPRMFHLWLHLAPLRVEDPHLLVSPSSAPCSQKHTCPSQVKASRRTGSREQTGKEQQVWGCLTAQENFPGPHLCSPGSPRHPSASAYPGMSSALTSARRTELTSLMCGAGDGESPTFLPLSLRADSPALQFQSGPNDGINWYPLDTHFLKLKIHSLSEVSPQTRDTLLQQFLLHRKQLSAVLLAHTAYSRTHDQSVCLRTLPVTRSHLCMVSGSCPWNPLKPQFPCP